MTPAIALNRFLWSLALGMALGLAFDFIRPIRPRFLGDLLFLIFFGFTWLQLAFSICCRDLRMGYLLGMLGGWVLCICTVGKWLQCLFYGFFHFLARILSYLHQIIRKIFVFFKKILKVLFAIRKK